MHSLLWYKENSLWAKGCKFSPSHVIFFTKKKRKRKYKDKLTDRCIHISLKRQMKLEVT